MYPNALEAAVGIVGKVENTSSSSADRSSPKGGSENGMITALV